MQVYVVGEEFPNDIPPQLCGAIPEFLQPHGSELLVAMPNIHINELKTLTEGRIRVSVHFDTASNGLLVLFQFEGLGERLIFDCVFNATLINDIAVEEVKPNERLLISLTVVDSHTGLVAGLRVFTLHPQTTQKFMQAVQAQRSNPNFSTESFNQWADSLRRYSLEQLAEMYSESYAVGV